MTDITLSQLGISAESLETKLLEILAQDFWEKSFAGSYETVRMMINETFAKLPKPPTI